MKPRYGLGYLACLGAAALFLIPALAHAGTLDNARVMVHVGTSPAAPSSKACQPAYTGVDVDCQTWDMVDANFTGAGMTTRYALVVCRAVDGVGGLSLGIEYSPNLFCGFDLCTDGLEFSNYEWPKSGGGNRITWTTCGAELAPSYADRYSETASGLQVVFGSFYVYTYGGDGFFNVVKNKLSPGEQDDELAVGSCGAVTSFLPLSAGGQISIGSGSGFNACLDTPVVPTTWGGVKSRFLNSENTQNQ